MEKTLFRHQDRKACIHDDLVPNAANSQSLGLELGLGHVVCKYFCVTIHLHNDEFLKKLIRSVKDCCICHIIFSDKPDPPVIGRVTHCSVELFWDQERKHTESDVGSEVRTRYCVQEEEGKSRRYRTVYR
jgi:hypothetical protein